MKKNILYQVPCSFVTTITNDNVLCQSSVSAGATTESFEIGDAIDFD